MTRSKTTSRAPVRTGGRTELLTVEVVARMITGGNSVFYQWSYLGEGPPVVRVGRHLRYPGDLLDLWIERGMKQRRR